ncbi:Crp/Fnr family transcriptional regulator [Microcoleus sp. FACHB-672]|uniref:Crp/Fnr family transcriptional regulator n=1 Tax=Microcoleus sp. FACHB-672 TaxID=2692825 RepID=UPI0016879F97|nr:Crp/Fnr family transcriptional regulator [Microcoleus sp. FACHB-672]MBD2042211.1 Crp/Fnr family transcriptional regulator [Microcoleus sp. FACHB-672]
MKVHNRLLTALPREVSEKLAPHLKLVSLERGKILHLPGETIHDVYFPLDCLISITITMKDGSTAETGVIGNREMLGVNAFMGGSETTQTEYIVQIAGTGLKTDASVLLDLFDHNKEVRDLLLRFTQALIAQISQTTACNRLHVLEQRFGRWLLESQTRMESDELLLTQEFLGHMLGVRRAGVTQAAQKFQEKSLIHYSRGRVHIIDQQGLEAAACECFKTVGDEYNRLLGAK